MGQQCQRAWCVISPYSRLILQERLGEHSFTFISQRPPLVCTRKVGIDVQDVTQLVETLVILPCEAEYATRIGTDHQGERIQFVCTLKFRKRFGKLPRNQVRLAKPVVTGGVIGM